MTETSALVSGDNVVIAIIASYLIQWFKDSRAKWLQWLTSEHPEVLRAFAAFVAALSTAGIYYTFEGGVLTISGLTIDNVVGFAIAAVSQFVLQHASFRMLISTPRKIQSGTGSG